MKELTYTLLTDGSSDRVLQHIINWMLNELLPTIPVQGEYADLSYLKNPPSPDRLDQRIEYAISFFPCDILFVHRDAERISFENREAEIRNYWQRTNVAQASRMIPVIPVRMTEAWLLIDIEAIKIAAGNRNYAGPLVLPRIASLENERDPKEILFELLRTASNLKGRNLDKLNVHVARHRIAETISDFSPLRRLSSFQHFEETVRETLSDMHLLD